MHMSEQLVKQSKSSHILIEWGNLGQIRWFEGAKWLYEPVAVLATPILALLIGQIVSLPVIFYVLAANADEAAALAENPATANESLLNLLYSNPQALAWLTILSFGAMHFVVWAWIRLMERREWWTIGLPFEAIGGWQVALYQYGRGLLIGFGLQMGVLGILALLGMIEFEAPFAGLSGIVLLNIVILFLAFVVQGAAEEVLTRGLILQVIGRKYGLWVSVLISSLIFMALHLLNPNLSALAVANLFLAGLLFALYALNEGTIWGACALHSIWNWTMGNLLGLEVSGIEFAAQAASLIDLQEAGPDWITGGSFGPEGGLVVMLVLVAVCGFLLARFLRTG